MGEGGGGGGGGVGGRGAVQGGKLGLGLGWRPGSGSTCFILEHISCWQARSVQWKACTSSCARIPLPTTDMTIWAGNQEGLDARAVEAGEAGWVVGCDLGSGDASMSDAVCAGDVHRPGSRAPDRGARPGARGRASASGAGERAGAEGGGERAGAKGEAGAAERATLGRKANSL